MRYRRLFKVVFYQLLLSGFAALAFTGKLDWISAGLYLTALAVAYVKGEAVSQRHAGLSKGRMVLVFAGFLVLFAADFLFVAGEFTLAVIHVAMAVSILKLFTARTARDYLYLFLIAFGFLLVSTTFTIDIGFVLFASWFMVAGILALMLFEIRTSSIYFSQRGDGAGAAAPPLSPLEPASPGRVNVSPGLITGLGGLIYVLMIGLTVPLFAILPRLSFGMWQLQLSDRQEISGFSDTTELGDVTSIKLNDAVVMRIRTNPEPARLPPDLKWKGIALDRYDGRGWSLSVPWKQMVALSPDGLFPIARRHTPERLLYQEVFLEPISSQVLFLAHRQLAITREARSVSLTCTGTPGKGYEHFQKFRYAGYSDIHRFSDAELAQAPAGYPLGLSTTLLEIPNRSPQVARLVEDVTRGIDSPYRRARALEAYLRNNYGYALEMDPCPPDRDPVEFFLFDMRRGHCEYFASALAIMMRYAKIPAQVVNGFQRGDVNPFNGVLVVRQSDAHSWVEACFVKSGWVEFDATPPVREAESSRYVALLENLIESVQFLWIQDVVNYDVSDQVELFRSIRAGAADWRKSAALALKRAQEWFNERLALVWRRASTVAEERGGALATVGLAALLALLVLPALFRWGGRRWRRLHRDGRPGRAAGQIYGRFLKAAERAGFRREGHETPREFSARLGAVLPRDVVDEFTDLYYDLRFNPRSAAAEIMPRLDGLMRRIEAAVRGGGA
jgi:hypothetical protein